MRIIFFGTPQMSANLLDALIEKKIDIAAVVTRPDAPQGRSQKLIPPEVKKLCQEKLPNIPILQPTKCSTDEMIEKLKSFNADLYVVVAYGEILSEKLLESCPNGAINVHFSLLPHYRGAAPIQRVLMNGEKQTGVSIIRLVKKMDAGDVLGVETFDIPDTMTGGELSEALCTLGTRCLFKVLDDFANNCVQAARQDHSQATFAPKITQDECMLDWSKPASALHNLVRAMAPRPGAWCEVIVKGQKKRLKVFSSEVVDAPDSTKLIAPCADGYLHLQTVQLEGKPKMTEADFIRGILPAHIQFKI